MFGHLSKGKGLVCLWVLRSAIVDCSIAAAELHALVISTMLGLGQWVSNLLPDAVALMVSRGVGHIEVVGLTSQKSVFICTSSILNGDVLFVHGQEALRLNAKVNLAKTAASLTLLATLDGLEAFGQLVGAVCRIISGCYWAAAISEVLLNCFYFV